MMRHDDHEIIKDFADVLSIATVLGTLVDALPAIAALLSIIWTLIRIFESETFQNFINRLRRRK